jgi:Haem-binding domain
MKTWLKRILLFLLAVFLLGQFYRPSRVNPPVDPDMRLYAVAQVPSDVQLILDRSCRDCHTSETVWPWYSNVFPINWFLASHVEDGRRQINFSDWGALTPAKQVHKLEELCDQVKQGDMPLKTYLPLHPSAKLTDADRKRLCQWSEQLRQEMLKKN